MEYIDDEYVITNKISDTNIAEMRNNMDSSDAGEFDKFVEEIWGSSQNQAQKVLTGKKRGRKPKNV